MSTLRARREAAVSLAGTYTQPGREEWAASCLVEGWSPRLVALAISGGPLPVVRTAIREGIPKNRQGDKHFCAAVRAVAMIDSGASVETHYPSYGPETPSLQRRTYAPPRLRAD